MEPTTSTPAFEDLVQRHVRLLDRIDRTLQKPVDTLLRVVLLSPGSAAEGIPDWIGEAGITSPTMDRFTAGICCGTVQRLHRYRRRFDWLGGYDELREAGLVEEIARSFLPRSSYPRVRAEGGEPGRPRDGITLFSDCVQSLGRDVYGGLNPLAASQVFRVLMEGGEDLTHSALGFVSFFAMTWSLYRRFPDELNIGARIEPSQPTAYITAKSLLPVMTLRGICHLRARLYDRVHRSLRDLEALVGEEEAGLSPAAARWEFARTLGNLRAVLGKLAEIAIARSEFIRCEEEIAAIAAQAPDGGLGRHYQGVLASLNRAVQSIIDTSGHLAAEADDVLTAIDNEVLKVIGGSDWMSVLDHRYGLRFAREYETSKRYVRDLKKAGREALGVCRQAWKALDRVGGLSLGGETGSREPLETALRSLAEANRVVEKALGGPVGLPARWCRAVVDREIAYASADNLTDFDPAELISATVVARRARLLTSPAQIADALAKALVGAQLDGSWRLGHPYYTRDDVAGIRAPSSDIVWMLTRAVESNPGIVVADAALERYVEWLERRMLKLESPDGPAWVGWGTDRVRHGPKINLATTAYSINALLEIRDLQEYRLWELCRQRFTVPSPGFTLADTDPVDLSAPRASRLHSVLAAMIRDTRQGAGSSTVPYSLVLHGPPGSSKTRLAEAVSREMWDRSSRWGESEPRLIRVTPADFTRGGEDRIDSEARTVFELLSHVRGVTILFDEIDDLLARRIRHDGARAQFMDLVVPAMLNRLADLRSACERQEIAFVLGTNYVDTIEPALIRKGRIDRALPVVYPDWKSRAVLVAKKARKARREAEELLEQGQPERADRLRDAADRLDALTDHVVRETAGMTWQGINETARSVLAWLMDAARTPAQGGVASEPTLVAQLASGENIGQPMATYAERVGRHPGCAEIREEYVRQRFASLRTDFPFDSTADELRNGLLAALTLTEDERAALGAEAAAETLRRTLRWEVQAFRGEFSGPPSTPPDEGPPAPVVSAEGVCGLAPAAAADPAGGASAEAPTHSDGDGPGPESGSAGTTGGEPAF